MTNALDSAIEWVKAHRQATLIGAVALAVLMGVVASLGGGGNPESDLASGTTSPSSPGSATTIGSSDVAHPDVEQVACETLITDDDAFDVLFPDGGGGLFTLLAGETCTFDPGDDSGVFIRIEPGAPSDFGKDARLLGSLGSVVGGVGDAALWFTGAGSDTGSGLLAVRQDTELGVLLFRLTIGLPEMDDATRMGQAVSLADKALTRFPGVTVEPADPVVISFDEEEPPPARSLDDLLTQGVSTGRWTLGEGLTALLDWMVNSTPGVVPADLSETSGSGVVAVAQSYLGTQAEDRPVIEELLGMLLDSRTDVLEGSIPSGPTATGLLVSAAPIAQEQSDPCAGATMAEPCRIEFEMSEYSDLEGGKYEVFLAQPSGWTDMEVTLAKEALHDAALTFEELGAMPSAWLELTSGDLIYTGYSREDGCLTEVGDFLVGTDADDLKQIFAREIAFCLIEGDLFAQLHGNERPLAWLVYGLANYLSDVVYPTNDLEHHELPGRLSQEELSTTVPDRSWTNWIVFEHVHSFLGAEGVMDMMRGLPPRGDLVSALAEVSGMPEMYHDLERALSDSNVSDVGLGTIPFDPRAWVLPLAEATEVPLEVPRFGVRRLHIQVPDGKYACVDSFTQGEVRMSWRPGAPGGVGDWSDELPGSFRGESVLVLSTVAENGRFILDVTDVSDNEDCQDEPSEPGASNGCALDLCGPSEYYFDESAFDE